MGTPGVSQTRDPGAADPRVPMSAGDFASMFRSLKMALLEPARRFELTQRLGTKSGEEKPKGQHN